MQTELVKQENPEILLKQYPEPAEPEQTVGGLIEYVLEQKAINQKHNLDKEKLKR